MGSDSLIIDFSAFDENRVIADLDEIRRYNRQRYEMEQLTAVVYEDLERKLVVGYKDLAPNEFWVRGHMPGAPLLPGVILCEIAAQLCSYYCGRYNVLGLDATLGFGGLNEVRFRDVVVPGKRVFVACELTRVRKGKLVISRFQAFVDRKLVCEGEILGIALPNDAAIQAASDGATKG
jgi:3-hydroxyacyl-[acyl-carrier-protein] dehydratase